MNPLSIYVVSGGKGVSGEQLARTALAQFPDAQTSLIIVPDIRTAAQIEEVVSGVAASGGIIVHTLVDDYLRSALTEQAKRHNVTAIDLIGNLLLELGRTLSTQPLGQPGLYRHLRQEYFERIEAIEFTVDHDDGRKPHELPLAEIVLAGVSRVGKTPLSMYLSTRGWKVANVPLVRELVPPQQLFEIDRWRVIGLTIEPGQLVTFRQRRQKNLGVAQASAYTQPSELLEEIEFARGIFKRGGFTVLDTTDRPIEESAEFVISHVTRQMKDHL